MMFMNYSSYDVIRQGSYTSTSYLSFLGQVPNNLGIIHLRDDQVLLLNFFGQNFTSCWGVVSSNL